MVKSPIAKDFFREIRKTSGRFVSITLLIMLAVGFYSGLRVTRPDMLITADAYIDGSNMYDVRVASTLGLTKDDVSAIAGVDGVLAAEGSYSLDAEVTAPNSNIIVSLEALGSAGINTPELLEGRLPQSENECVAERKFTDRMEIGIGGSFRIERLEEQFEDALTVGEFTVVGIVRSPLYLTHFQRGSSRLGGGSVYAYVFITPEAVTLDYFTEINVTVLGAREESAYSDGYDDVVRPVSGQIEQLESERTAARRSELTSDAEKKLADGKKELSDGRLELSDARSELDDAKRKYADGVTELAEGREQAEAELSEALEELRDAERQINSGRQSLRDAQAEIDAHKARAEQEFSEAEAELGQGMLRLGAGWDEYYAGLSEHEAGQAQWDSLPDEVRQTMPETAAMLEQTRAQLEAAYAELSAQEELLNAAWAQYYEQRDYFNIEITAAQESLDAETQRLADAEAELRRGRAEYDRESERVIRELADGETELADALIKITDGEKELSDAEKELSDAEQKISDAEKELSDIPEGEWYVLGRESSPGYTGFGQDADRMGALGNIFPVIFFAVAVLVCLTTMTRMVDEQRVEIGTFKALGLSRVSTAGKFMSYGFLAALIGTTGGLALGMMILPGFIYNAYSILYDMPTLETPLHLQTVITASAVALCCTAGATLAACAAALRETPSNLLRPRAPAAGKRVFLEYITPLWRRMSFFAKVSARNVLRYKKRLIMTVVGVAGCTALLVTGFGLRDSIVDLPAVQFGQIYTYDLLVTIRDDATGAEIAELENALAESGDVADYTLVRSVAADFVGGAGLYSGDIIIPETPGELPAFINLLSYGTGERLELSDDGVIITAKLAELLDIGEGGTLTVVSGGRYTVSVTSVAEHYVEHYMYMSPSCYTRVFGEEYAPNQMLVRCSDDTEETINRVSAALLTQEATGYSANFRSAADSFEKSIGSINSVIVIIVVAAGALAFIVLFNLSNINITERRRELATIKVLGFFDSEVTRYIFRENTFLTLFGIALGLVAGRFLHRWLITTVEVDFTMFLRTLRPASYVIAALLTAGFAIIVNIIGHIGMKRINMVESLKTNE